MSKASKMAKKTVKKSKRGPGKPKKVITPAQMKKAEGYAYDGCQNGTIATLMGWSDAFISDRKDIRKRLTKKRAERKVWLRQMQDIHAEGGNGAAMSMFLGKNDLGQSDKQEHIHTEKHLSQDECERLRGLLAEKHELKIVRSA